MSSVCANSVRQAALLTPDEMAEADRLTMEGGVAGIVLMERAAAAVAEAVLRSFPGASRIAVLAGPGNNGGDAYAAARLLAAEGRRVVVFSLVDPAELGGDAKLAATAFDGATRHLSAFEAGGHDLVIDGLFGAGLSRPVEGSAAAAIADVNASGLPVVAIDLPSGVSGSSGGMLGTAIEADVTVTFFRRKPGHLLQPGRSLCGRTMIAEIGIPEGVLDRIAPRNFANEPVLWRHEMRMPEPAGHKYDRGHAVVFSGGATRTGAARLSAMGALRGGAGLVTVFSPGSALLVNASHLTAIMLKRCNGIGDLAEHLMDERLNAFVLGPGFGVGQPARDFTAAVLEARRRLVLDADGITSFADDPEKLFGLASQGELVLTPHAGEFRRLFPEIASSGLSRLEQARAGAERSGAVIVLKGSDTVVAAPDSRAAINATGTPWLATAGSGDVLAGIVAARLATGVPAFEAAAAAVWMHGKAAEAFGPGLIAEDLPNLLPGVWESIATP